MEEWRDIIGYEGLYEVSNTGKVRSTTTGKIKKLSTNKGGSLYTTLWKNGDQKIKLVHRLVVEAFIKNSNNLLEINHKDENKLNNNVDNLELCTHKYNCNYGNRNKKVADKLSIPVLACKNNSYMYFNSIREASRILKIDASHIVKCCKSLRKTAGGCTWKYLENS